ncbi:hypothetical protein, partial [Escherichia coli]|uniref:hypothetical protein n=1 Tax=Escherichia coli TaxID=562 RepID=UPI00195347E1
SGQQFIDIIKEISKRLNRQHTGQQKRNGPETDFTFLSSGVAQCIAQGIVTVVGQCLDVYPRRGFEALVY